jgi:hypothetical protein
LYWLQTGHDVVGISAPVIPNQDVVVEMSPFKRAAMINTLAE